MKPISRRPMPVILLVLVIILASLPFSSALGQSPEPGSSSQAESDDIRTYRVSKVFTKEDRTAVARTGAAIEEIGPDFVTVRATEQEASEIAKLGYPIEEMLLERLDDFPPADEAYHNYAEMVAEVQQVTAAHPGLISAFRQRV